jgi:hypothetical protein
MSVLAHSLGKISAPTKVSGTTCAICGSRAGSHQAWCAEDFTSVGDWAIKGLCTAGDVEWPDDRDELAQINICERCPVRVECAEYAIETDEPVGIWGGLTTRQRRLVGRGHYTLKQVLAGRGR